MKNQIFIIATLLLILTVANQQITEKSLSQFESECRDICKDQSNEHFLDKDECNKLCDNLVNQQINSKQFDLQGSKGFRLLAYPETCSGLYQQQEACGKKLQSSCGWQFFACGLQLAACMTELLYNVTSQCVALAALPEEVQSALDDCYDYGTIKNDNVTTVTVQQVSTYKACMSSLSTFDTCSTGTYGSKIASYFQCMFSSTLIISLWFIAIILAAILF